MKVSELIAALQNLNPDATVAMPDGLEITAILDDGEVVYLGDEEESPFTTEE